MIENHVSDKARIALRIEGIQNVVKNSENV